MDIRKDSDWPHTSQQVAVNEIWSRPPPSRVLAYSKYTESEGTQCFRKPHAGIYFLLISLRDRQSGSDNRLSRARLAGTKGYLLSKGY